MRRLMLLIALLAAGCGGSSSTAPSAPTPTPTPTPSTLTLVGTLTSTNGGAPLSAAMDFGLATTTSSASGAYSVSLPATAPTLTLTITGGGLLTRRLYVAPGARTVNLDAVSMTGFDLAFYRQMVRNGFEGGNEPLRRWTSAPSVYLRTVRDDGVAVDAAMLDTVETVIRDAMPRWSGLNPATITRGSDTRAGQTGWFTIVWPGVVGADRVCGTSNVALSGGTMTLFVPSTAACGCDGSARIRPRVVRHELGHAMGFWHTDNPSDVMVASSSACDYPISARELAHAAIAYRRPVGNVDPDTDPSNAVNLAPMRMK